MAKYEVKKISDSSYHADGSPVYDYTLEYATWKELVADMAYRDKYANVIYLGRGGHIYREGVLIASTDDLTSAGQNPETWRTDWKLVTLARVREEAAR